MYACMYVCSCKFIMLILLNNCGAYHIYVCVCVLYVCFSQWLFGIIFMHVSLSITYYVLWLNEIINYEWNFVRNCYYKFWKIQMNFRLAYMALFGLFNLKVFYSAHYFSVEVFKRWLFLEWFWFNTIFTFYNFAILFVLSFSVIIVSALWVK